MSLWHDDKLIIVRLVHPSKLLVPIVVKLEFSSKEKEIKDVRSLQHSFDIYSHVAEITKHFLSYGT